jgi:hypothetical protein
MCKHTKHARVHAKSGGYPLPPETNARLHALYAPDEDGIVRFDV